MFKKAKRIKAGWKRLLAVAGNWPRDGWEACHPWGVGDPDPPLDVRRALLGRFQNSKILFRCAAPENE